MLNSSSLDKYQSSRVLVENNSGSSISSLKIVQLNGMGTVYPQVVLGSPAAPAFGLTVQSISNSGVGVIYTLGLIYDLNTSAWTPGTELYCDSSGSLVVNPVNAGDAPIAVCVNQNPLFGILYLFIQTNQYKGSLANNVVTNAKLSQMAPGTIKGNNGTSTANPIDLTVSQLTAMLTPAYAELHCFTGYSGSTQTGSYNQPYNTLQGAINAGIGLGIANVVILMHDSPTENVTINNWPNGLTIQGYTTTAKDSQTIKINGNVTLSGSTTRVRIKDIKIAYPGGTQPDLIDTSQGRNYFSNVDFGGGGGIQYTGSWARWHEFIDCTINGVVNIAGTPSAGSQVSMWRTRGAPTFTLNSSNVTLALYNNENLGTITQTAGSLLVDGGSGFVSSPAIISTANSPDTMNLLNVSLQISGTTFAQINKTGTAPYNISNVWRNESIDVLTGTRQGYGATSADQKYVPATPGNWSSPAPSDVKDAIDRIAALLVVLNSGTSIP
jgi:hypothetical protein